MATIKRNAQLMPVDYQKLKAFSEKSGTSISMMSRAIGYNETYIHKAARRGTLRKSTIIMLNKMFGIEYDNIKPDEPESTETPEPTPSAVPAPDTDAIIAKLTDAFRAAQSAPVNYDRMHAVVKDAIVEAVMRIVNDAAMKQAIEEMFIYATCEGMQKAWREKLNTAARR